MSSSFSRKVIATATALGFMASLTAGISVFQNGLDGYEGTVDTEIRGGDPELDGSTVTVLNPDGSDGGGEVHILIRFDDMFGDGPGQIPHGKSINSVVLTLDITGQGDDIDMHRLLKEWEDTDTWLMFDSDWEDGVTPDDEEAAIEIDASFPAPTGVAEIVLPASTVQAWLDGTAPNHGWTMLPTGTDGVDFSSSENSDTAGRPKLTVAWGESGQPFVTGISGSAHGFVILLEDGIGPNPKQVDPDSIQVKLDGADVSTTVGKTDTTTSVTYAAPDYFDSASEHDVVIDFADNSAPPVAQSGELFFQAPAYVTLSANFRVNEEAVDKSTGGFNVRVHQLDFARPAGDNLPGPLDQLAGLILDPVTGEPAENWYDDFEFEDGIYVEEDVINYNQDAFDVDDPSTQEGNFGANSGSSSAHLEDRIPGIPGYALADTDNVAAEITAFLELEKGLYTMGVNSDDGFIVDSGVALADALALRLGVYDGDRGSADSIFRFEVTEAGIYPFRLVWWEGDGGANLEWFTVAEDGTMILINDSGESASVKAYREGPSLPYIVSISPAPSFSNARPNTTIDIVLEDGDTEIQTGSVELEVDGAAVTPSVSKSGSRTTIGYDPDPDLPAFSSVSVRLTYADNASPANVRMEEYTFTTFVTSELLFAIDEDTMWRYQNTGADLGTAWRETDFDDSGWPEGAALLAAESGATAEPIRTDLVRVNDDGDNIVTDYYRGRFTLDEVPSGKQLELRHVVDDGVVVYINGQEVYRFGLTGDVNYQTLASGHENSYEGPFLIVADSLVVGENVIAAEVHQSSVDSSDSVFGAELWVVTSPTVEPPGEIAIRLDGANVVLEWDSGTLQSSDDVAGPYADVPGATSGTAIAPEGAQKFYRTR